MKHAIEITRTFLNRSIWQKRFLFTILGALAGYAYYYFIGCASGACPISSNPYISTMYGALFGLVMTIGGKKQSADGQ